MYKWLMILLLCGSSAILFAQKPHRIVSYNVENLFDTKDDPHTNDSDFTPTGKYHWNREKYRSKLLGVARTIVASGDRTLPTFVGLCEIENAEVIDDLLSRTSLRGKGYRYLHRESPDARGIDVALLYREKYFQPLNYRFLRIDSLFPRLKTREVLYTCGILSQRDTIHLFVCHLPSMVGGEKKSEWKREAVAGMIREVMDSLFSVNPRTNIVIMGDFNGVAGTSAQRQTLQARSVKSVESFTDTVLYNTSTGNSQAIGSYKYRGRWQNIDHIIVSGSLLNGQAGLQCQSEMQIFAPDFLLEEDENYIGYKPRRTFTGSTYHGGTSDHLPVFIDLFQTE